MRIRPTIALKYGRINAPIKIPLQDLALDDQGTYISVNSAAGSTTLTVDNISIFSINQILLIGGVGQETSEIIKTSSSVAPSGSTITLASATKLPHSASTRILMISYDQVEISNATITTGTKTVLTTASLDPTSDFTAYDDAVSVGGYYFARFKHSITNLFSPYSDPAPYSGYTLLSARSIIDSAQKGINKYKAVQLDDDFSFQQIDNCQTEVLRELKRWSFMQSFNQVIGQTSIGVWSVAAPSDLDDQFSNRSIYNVKIGKETNLTYVDKEKWDEITWDVAHSKLAVAISVGNSTATLTSSADFDDAGTITAGSNSYSYTANDRSTGVLTLSVASTTTSAINSDVFSGAAMGEPVYWTIWGGNIYMFPVCNDTYDGRNIYMDYYKKQTQIIKDSDEVVVPDQTIIQYYLQWKYLNKLSNGEQTPSSLSYFKQYEMRKDMIKSKDTLGRSFTLKPMLNQLVDTYEFSDDDRRTRTGNFPNS